LSTVAYSITLQLNHTHITRAMTTDVEPLAALESLMAASLDKLYGRYTGRVALVEFLIDGEEVSFEASPIFMFSHFDSSSFHFDADNAGTPEAVCLSPSTAAISFRVRTSLDVLPEPVADLTFSQLCEVQEGQRFFREGYEYKARSAAGVMTRNGFQRVAIDAARRNAAMPSGRELATISESRKVEEPEPAPTVELKCAVEYVPGPERMWSLWVHVSGGTTAPYAQHFGYCTVSRNYALHELRNYAFAMQAAIQHAGGSSVVTGDVRD